MRKICLQCETKNLDEYRRLSEFAAEIGVTHVNVGEVEPSLWQWDRNRYDPYPNWGMYHPTLFKFIVPDVLKQYLPVEYAKRNLENLIARVEILREFGLKAAFSGMEPGWLPEEVYQADLIVKILPPTPEEANLMRPRSVLFSMIQLNRSDQEPPL